MTIANIYQDSRQAAAIAKYLQASGLQGKSLEALAAADLVRLSAAVRSALCQSSAKTILATIASGLRRWGCPLDLSALRVRNVRPVKIYLTEDEISGIGEVKAMNAAEDYAKTLFLVCARTGARVSDALALTPANICGGTLSYVSQKTSVEAVVPVSGHTADLIFRLSARKHDYTLAHYNNLVRQLACLAGIKDTVKVFSAGERLEGEKWRFVSSHTARRSFATNLYLRGCDIYDISRMMGHSSTAMTNGYISSPARKLSEKTLAFFRD